MSSPIELRSLGTPLNSSDNSSDSFGQIRANEEELRDAEKKVRQIKANNPSLFLASSPSSEDSSKGHTTDSPLVFSQSFPSIDPSEQVVKDFLPQDLSPTDSPLVSSQSPPSKDLPKRVVKDFPPQDLPPKDPHKDPIIDFFLFSFDEEEATTSPRLGTTGDNMNCIEDSSFEDPSKQDTTSLSPKDSFEDISSSDELPSASTPIQVPKHKAARDIPDGLHVSDSTQWPELSKLHPHKVYLPDPTQWPRLSKFYKVTFSEKPPEKPLNPKKNPGFDQDMPLTMPPEHRKPILSPRPDNQNPPETLPPMPNPEKTLVTTRTKTFPRGNPFPDSERRDQSRARSPKTEVKQPETSSKLPGRRSSNENKDRIILRSPQSHEGTEVKEKEAEPSSKLRVRRPSNENETLQKRGTGTRKFHLT